MTEKLMWGNDEIEREFSQWRGACDSDAEAWRMVAYQLRDNYEANMQQMQPIPIGEWKPRDFKRETEA